MAFNALQCLLTQQSLAKIFSSKNISSQTADLPVLTRLDSYNYEHYSVQLYLSFIILDTLTVNGICLF